MRRDLNPYFLHQLQHLPRRLEMPRDPPARSPPDPPQSRQLRKALPHVGRMLRQRNGEGRERSRMGKEEVEAEDGDGRVG